MVNSPLGVDNTAPPAQDNWGQPVENQPLEPMSANGDTSAVSLPMDSAHLQGGGAPVSGMDAMVSDGGDSHGKQEQGYRDKQPKVLIRSCTSALLLSSLSPSLSPYLSLPIRWRSWSVSKRFL
jgi:hypothetical protein